VNLSEPRPLTDEDVQALRRLAEEND